MTKLTQAAAVLALEHKDGSLRGHWGGHLSRASAIAVRMLRVSHTKNVVQVALGLVGPLGLRIAHALSPDSGIHRSIAVARHG